ncbi:hypothetical protein [Amycolatopsis eburnea]|uniref:Peptidase M41 domain-containing protein n=1 Tax=Amycolatopsis eburnea TaxID=2267691 RepID=A0A3R9EBA2_9PSEU|nr:hypothetical protein [Amycolatopsis eburnea]RSD26435.1 hypothetical protein EIY87_00165 [Amycolatopsis eburnea]
MPKYTAEEAEILALAAHEVGHAMVCSKYGIKVVKLWINGDAGQTQHAEPDMTDQKQVDGALAVFFGGLEAGAAWVQRNAGMWRGQALRWSRQCSESDLSNYRGLRRHGSVSQAKHQAMARTVISSNWGRIDRLAKKLATDGHLGGRHFN